MAAEKTFEAMTEVVHDLPGFIKYLETTQEDEWAVDVVRTKGNKQNCLFGHLVNWIYGKDHHGSIMFAWDIFEEMWASTYMVYAVNDGQNPKYDQLTPKQRCLAYMKDLWLAIEVPTWRAMEIDYEAYQKREREKSDGQL